jgi:hypothetical protein
MVGLFIVEVSEGAVARSSQYALQRRFLRGGGVQAIARIYHLLTYYRLS